MKLENLAVRQVSLDFTFEAALRNLGSNDADRFGIVADFFVLLPGVARADCLEEPVAERMALGARFDGRPDASGATEVEVDYSLVGLREIRDAQNTFVAELGCGDGPNRTPTWAAVMDPTECWQRPGSDSQLQQPLQRSKVERLPPIAAIWPDRCFGCDG